MRKRTVTVGTLVVVLSGLSEYDRISRTYEEGLRRCRRIRIRGRKRGTAIGPRYPIQAETIGTSTSFGIVALARSVAFAIWAYSTGLERVVAPTLG